MQRGAAPVAHPQEKGSYWYEQTGPHQTRLKKDHPATNRETLPEPGKTSTL